MSYTSINKLTSLYLSPGLGSMKRDPENTVQFYKNNSGNFAFNGEPDSDKDNTSVRHLIKPNIFFGLDRVSGAYNTPMRHLEIIHNDICYYVVIDNSRCGDWICREIHAKTKDNRFYEVEVLTLPEDHPGTLFFVKRVATKS